MTDTLRRALREPLVHFAAAGSLLFVIHGALKNHPERPATTVLDAKALSAARLELARELGHTPAPEEARLLEDRLIDDELMFREGIALGLDRGDVMVRRRIVQKMQFFAEDLSAGAEPSQAELQHFLDTHADQYRRPERVTFSHLFFSGQRPEAEKSARRALVQLKNGESPQADPFALGDRFVGRTRHEVEEQLGSVLMAGVFSAKPGAWVDQPLSSAFGYHLVQIEAHQPAELPALAAILPQLKGDLIEERRAQARLSMLRGLRRKYSVPGEPASSLLMAPVLGSEEQR